MKKINLKEQFKRRMFKQLSEAAPPDAPPIPPTLDPILPGVLNPNYNPLSPSRRAGDPYWQMPGMPPHYLNPWDAAGPQWREVPDEIRELFPKGPKQYQRFMQDTYELQQMFEQFLQFFLQWYHQNGSPVFTEVRLYMMNNNQMQIFMNNLSNILGRLGYTSVNPSDLIFDILNWFKRTSTGSLTFGVGNPWGNKPEGQQQYPWDKPRFGENGQIIFQGPIYFPNGTVYISDPHPPGSPQWYQINPDGSYAPLYNDPYGFGPGGSPAINQDENIPVTPGSRWWRRRWDDQNQDWTWDQNNPPGFNS